VTPAGQAICDALGVSTAPELMAVAGGEIVAQSRTTKTVRLATAAGTAYLKRYFVPSFRDWLRGALRWTWLGQSKAQREWVNADRVAKAGWGIAERLALAEVRTAGGLRGCAILTAEIAGAERLDVAWLQGGMDADERRRLLNALARQLRASLDHSYVDRNCYVRNILVRAPGGECKFFKIDSPRAVVGRRDSVDLAALDAFARNVCSFRERWRVLRRFAAGYDRSATLRLAGEVDARSAALQGREAPRMHDAQEASAVA
jgi:hypothetical protein